MTDREMLLMSYGAVKACISQTPELGDIVDLLEAHLFPPVVVNQMKMPPIPSLNTNTTPDEDLTK